MKITINFKTSVSAFGDDGCSKEQEVDRILNEIKIKVVGGRKSDVIVDYDGNLIGDWKVTDK